MKFGAVVITAGLAGLSSFGLLTAAIWSEYWYIIEVNKPNLTIWEDLNSHSGLWRIYEGKNSSSYFIQSFLVDPSLYTEQERHLLNMHKVVVVLLPISLVLLVFGGICGLVSSLVRSHTLLTATACYLFLCSVLTMSGVSVYISYSQQARAELERQVGTEQLAHVQAYFGWSLGLAWLSFGLEVLTGLLLLLAGAADRLRHRREASTPVSIAYRSADWTGPGRFELTAEPTLDSLCFPT